MTTIQTLKGFRDFLPVEQKKRNYVKRKMSAVFELHGFEPLETPTLEYAELLAGKYGEEADQLLYRFHDRGEREVALRYDQTVPMARVISQHFKDPNNFLNNETNFFQIHRRYQIQNVYRAEKPQKGRYREFTQCDCDIFASQAPLADAEILSVFFHAFLALGIKDIVIQFNDRRQLYQIFEPYALETTQIKTFIQSLDKLDKITKEDVIGELTEIKKFDPKIVEEVFMKLESSQKEMSLASDMQQIISSAISLGVRQEALQFNPFLARGLDYYTGLIFEGIVPGLKGSLGGGGRYDNLIGQLGSVQCTAVGFGIGFDRTVEAVDELGLFPKDLTSATSKILVSVLPNTSSQSLILIKALRNSNLPAEIYPDTTVSLEKQIKYADKKGIPYITIVRDSEEAEQKITLKNLTSGDQQTITVEEIIKFLTT